MNRTTTLFAFLLVALTAACGRDPDIPWNAQDRELRSVEDMDQMFSNSGFTERTRLVLRDRQSWEEAWSTLHSGSSEVRAAPDIDFEADMVLLAAMGERPHGGYWIAITGAAATDELFYVSVTEKEPGDHCTTTQALTEPVAITRVARFDGDVRFLGYHFTDNCY